MTLVVDASVVVAALIDSGPDGTWAEALLASEDLAAAHLTPVEAANILRLAALAATSPRTAPPLPTLTLLALAVDLYAYEPFPRVWQVGPTSRPTMPGTSR